eukprot:TRINITY_DN541_c2_g1_i1.p1 TRINITY_DN541_c2_g1~~TRINITY_DN541_c2_g1_i1.p1  ORF type:complete len:1108 (-),score=103.60 TRINITY_DN541_c2_g1_i1:49-3372(-)
MLRQPLSKRLASVVALLPFLVLASAAIFDYNVQQFATFQRGSSNITRFYDVQRADFNNDGNLDLLLSFQRSPSNRFYISVWYGDALGFIPANIISVYDSDSAIGGSSSEIGIADLDGDGDLDLIWLLGSSSRRLQYAIQNSAGRTWSVTTRPESVNGTVSVPCDIDRNGKIDMVLANDMESMAEMYFNEYNGNGSVLLRRTTSQFTGIYAGPPTSINCFSRSAWNKTLLIAENFGDLFAVNIPEGGNALSNAGAFSTTLTLKRPAVFLSEGTNQALFVALSSDASRVAGAFRLTPSAGINAYDTVNTGLFQQSTLGTLGYGTLNTIDAVESFGAATHQMAMVVSTSAQLLQPAMLLMYDTDTKSTQVALNSPNAIFMGKTPRSVNGSNELLVVSSNSTHFMFNSVTVGVDPILEKKYAWIDTASSFTISLSGRNLSPFRGNISSLTIRWRPDTSSVVNTTCDTSGLVGCPSASWAADGTSLNCTFPASTQNCVIQAQVEIDLGTRTVQSRWVTIGWIAPNPARIIALPTTGQGYFNPIAVFVPMANTPSTWPGHIESLEFRLSGACSGNFISLCSSTYSVKSPIGFTCQIQMNATLLQSRCPVVAISTSRGVTNDPVVVAEALIPNFGATMYPKSGPGNNGSFISVDGTFTWYPFVPGSINVTFELVDVPASVGVSPCETPGLVATYNRPSGSPQSFSLTVPYTRNCRLAAKAMYSAAYQPNVTGLLATEFAPSFPLATIQNVSSSLIMAAVKNTAATWRFWTDFTGPSIFFGFRCPGESLVTSATSITVDGTCVSYDGVLIPFGANNLANAPFTYCASIADNLLPTVGAKDACLLHWAYSSSNPATWHPIARIAEFHTVNASSTRFKFDATITVNASGLSLPRQGESYSAVANVRCSAVVYSFPCGVLSVSLTGRWLQCQFAPNSSVSDLCSINLSVTRLSYTAPAAMVGSIIYPPNITDTGSFRPVYPGEGAYAVNVTGSFLPNSTESPVVGLSLEGTGCITPPALSITGLVLPASGPNQIIKFSFDQNVFNSSHHMCSLMVTVSRFGFSTKAFVARIVSRAPILDPSPLRGISLAANYVNVTGQELPIPEVVSSSLMNAVEGQG